MKIINITWDMCFDLYKNKFIKGSLNIIKSYGYGTEYGFLTHWLQVQTKQKLANIYNELIQLQ